MEYEIRPANKFSLGLNEIWKYRELFYTFAWRDIKIKYKQTYLGMAWALFQPLVMTILFSLSFGRIIAGSTDMNLPYPVFALSGFIIWNIFSTGLSNAGNSMVANANMIKKIYFPRLIIPVSSILVSVIDFFISFLFFIPVLYYYEGTLTWRALWCIPASLLLTCISTFGLGIFLAALNVKYRDFRYILPFFIQALLFATPVIFPVHISDNKILEFVLMLNPMTAPIEIFRSGFTGETLHWPDYYSSIGSSLVLLMTGIYYFRRTEAYFADVA